jgi:CHAT domain-containing protein/pimeloyl-ACP methyl ester carboxylesterase
MVKFMFNGAEANTAPDSTLQLKTLQPNVQITEYTASSVRSGGTTSVIEAEDHDVVVVQLSNEVEWHYRADDFDAFLKGQPDAKRGAKTNDLQAVPEFFVSPGSTRGGGLGEVVKTKGLKLITGMVAKGAAELLVEKMEAGLATGLHGLNANLEFIAFDKNTVVKDKPYLLFIHGTNSNTVGAFNELKKNDAYAGLFKYYEGRLLAFEHRTLSESPLINVAQLLSALPNNIILDVVSHSRGGIVADLLARCSGGGLPFDSNERKIIETNQEFAFLSKEADAANKAAEGKNLVVAKLVRVACPAAGTVLIDNRLDVVVNVFFNLLKLIPGAAACMPFTLFLDFVKAVVQERTDISVFAGLAAQIPGSPLMRMLNNPNRTINSELFVISGDVESSGILKSLLVMTTNLYFGEAHDLVVNSNSMFKGTYRSSVVREHFEQEPTVNHFNYFKNKKSQDALLAALTDSKKIDGLYETLGTTREITIEHKRGEAPGKKPAVFVLPGIMGSYLDDKIKKDRLWINFIGIASGELAKLEINRQDIEATAINSQTYNSLINFLSPDFDIYPVAYDWRKNLTEAADDLAKKIQVELDNKQRTNNEFHFIAHSMGGLVLRAMIKRHADLWKNITTSKKTKVLMMGVPNKGSYSAVRILLGKDSIVKKLALLDFKNSKGKLLEWFKQFPGLAQLLPVDEPGIFEKTRWADLQKNNNEFTGIPSDDVLKAGLEFYKSIEDTNYDNDIFRYIAGHDDSTPESFEIKNNKIVFTATSQGDGRVLWSTIPSTLSAENIFYVPADHGGIPAYEKAFEGFRQLLQQGKSTVAALSNSRPFTRGGATSQLMADSDVVTIPTDAELNEKLLSSRETAKKTAVKEIINISVVNGDLVHSKYPVVVGHFKGDGIIYAEKYLDKALNFKLSEYHLVNNYPGDIGTHLVILNDRNSNLICKGGVVVGLGEFGALTESRLLVSLTQAFLTLAIKFNELNESNTDKAAEFGISSLLIGSDFAGLRISTSVKTILMAVIQANEKLQAMSDLKKIPQTYKKISNIEIVEIYQHKAIQVGRIVKSFLEEDAFGGFRFVPSIIKKGSGLLKVIPDENQQDNWHRLEITVPGKDDGSQPNRHLLPIRFTAITDKAHADQEMVPANRVMVETIIEKIAKQSQWNKLFSQTLYELLIPVGFKGYGSNIKNMVLIVDDQTARYPWELLQDANGISEKPLVINTGLVRQLTSGNQTGKRVMNSSNRALVIGEPLIDPDKYPALPGAKAEAEKLSEIFLNNGLDVTPSINDDEIDIVPKLLTKSYKIIHIAAHGIVGQTINDPTGIVLGENIIFTSGDFNSIPVVPEFVFVNCCSSADYNVQVAAQMRKKYELAASVGTQLILMGVKAAIITGWEIDDAAAATFCDTFYQSMFTGKPFGEAIRSARERTYEQHVQTNTWGAYQCYGDPFYTFNTGKAWSKKTKPQFADAEEVIYALDNFISEISSSSKRKTAEESKSRIIEIVNELYADWKKDARITARLAELYKTIGLMKEALEYYEQLFGLENASYTVKTVEQYFNITVRYAITQLKSGEIKAVDAKKKINEAVHGLEKIKGETLERNSLIAASYRRLFDVDKKDFKALISAAAYYRKAYEYGEKLFNTIDYYPFFNWLHFAILLSSYKKNKLSGYLEIPPDIADLSDAALQNARQQDATEPGFYHKTADSSLHIAGLLMAKNNAEFEKHKKSITANFKAAWNKEGAAGEKDSFINYIEFIVSLLKALKPTHIKMNVEKAEALTDVIKEINE